MDRNTEARKALKKKSKASFEKVSDEEYKAIEIQKEEDGKDPEKMNIIRNYIHKLIIYEKLKSELDDIGYTVDWMVKNNEEVWKGPDQFISLATMKAKLADCYYGLRVFEKDFHTIKRQVFEAYKIDQKEIDAYYGAIMGVKEKTE
jgi:hypothetical protein